MLKKLNLLLIMALAGMLMMTSCKDDEDDSPTTGDVNMKVNIKVGDDTFAPGNTYTINGDEVKINIAQFYLSGVKFTSTDGTETVNDDYYLITSNSSSSALEDVEVGSSYDFQFLVGIDATTNAQTTEDFTTRPVGDVLGMQDPAMHWNWNSGYKFLRIDGEVDQDGDGVMEPFKYHIGSDAFYRGIIWSDQISIAEGTNLVNVEFDISRLLDGVDVSAEGSTMTMDNMPLAEKIRANYPQAFSIVQ